MYKRLYNSQISTFDEQYTQMTRVRVASVDLPAERSRWTALSGYNLFRPMQPGRHISRRIARKKSYKASKNEPFLPSSLCVYRCGKNWITQAVKYKLSCGTGVIHVYSNLCIWKQAVLASNTEYFQIPGWGMWSHCYMPALPSHHSLKVCVRPTQKIS